MLATSKVGKFVIHTSDVVGEEGNFLTVVTRDLHFYAHRIAYNSTQATQNHFDLVTIAEQRDPELTASEARMVERFREDGLRLKRIANNFRGW